MKDTDSINLNSRNVCSFVYVATVVDSGKKKKKDDILNGDSFSFVVHIQVLFFMAFWRCSSPFIRKLRLPMSSLTSASAMRLSLRSLLRSKLLA